MRKLLSSFVLFCFILSTRTARAELDTYGLGTGRNGAISISTAGTIINSYAAITSSLSPGATTISIGAVFGNASGFAAGDLIMIWQTTGLSPAPASGTPGPFNVGSSAVGRWEFARVAGNSSGTLTLTAPLIYSYAVGNTQVVRVPEYTSVTITGTGRIVPLVWNGSCGGIVAFLATGSVSNAGQINANAAGFRGGLYVNDASGMMGASGLDEPSPSGAQKGEGIVSGVYGASFTGRGNFANGGGGGVAFKAGGAGGGNGGAGGRGGRTDGFADGGRLVGGIGGGSLTYNALDHLFLGGGGGAGHGADASGAPGGRGGGVVFIRCNGMSGTGNVQASGGGGGSTASDGGSGGGAGGTIYLRSVGAATFGSASANGGVGGTVNTGSVGPGGGGGAGVILLQRLSGSGSANLVGGAAGNQQDPSAPDGAAYGATAGSGNALTSLPGGLVIPSAPSVVSPANGAMTNSRPTLSGTGPASITLAIYDGYEYLGTTTTDATGNFSYTVSNSLSNGSHTLRVYSMGQGLYSNPAFVNLTTTAALPVHLLSFEAHKRSGGVVLNWKAVEERTAVYEVQRSTDGQRFEVIGRVAARNNGEQLYTLADPTSIGSMTWYRLRMIDRDNSAEYSRVLLVRFGIDKGISVYPNPAASSLTLQLNLHKDATQLQISDASGKAVFTKQLPASGQGITTSIDISGLTPGIYYIKAGGYTSSFIKIGN